MENWLFMIAVLIVSLLIVFHGFVLLTVPDKYIPSPQWGPPKIELLRKQPLEFGKRILGFCIVSVGVWFFMRPVLSWMLHPTPGAISSGDSPLPPGMPRWDLLGLGIFTIAWVCYLILWPERSVRLMFSADPKRLDDKITLRLWTIRARLFAAVGLVFFALLLGDFIVSLR